MVVWETGGRRERRSRRDVEECAVFGMPNTKGEALISPALQLIRNSSCDHWERI